MNMVATHFICSEQAQQRSVDIGILIKIFSGQHCGGIHPLKDLETLIIGANSDCDLILSDESVAPRHCLIQRMGRLVQVRALDAPVRMGERELLPGESRELKLTETLQLGDVSLGLVPQTGRERRGRDALPLGQNPVTSGWRRFGLYIAVTLVGVGVMMLAMLPPGTPLVADAEAASGAPAVAVLTPASASDPTLSNKNGAMTVAAEPGGQAKDSSDSLQAVANTASYPAMSDPEGARIASNVREILRLSGINAKTRYLGQGEVEVRGSLGDETLAARLIQSRAMREIEGLARVVAINLDTHPEAPLDVPDKRVVDVVNGDDPYLVTQDGSRYYVGAELPGGERIASIEGHEILVESPAGSRRIPVQGARLDNLVL